MTGIVGALFFDKHYRIDPTAPQRAHTALRPWGPDGSATATVPGAWVGAASRTPEDNGSPLWDAERRLVIAFDGDLVGVPALRDELQRLGHRFSSATAAEVVLAAYRHWGVDCVDQLRGVFAFAVFDRRDHTLFLARDRLGVRPLYVHRDETRVSFASSMQGVLSQDRVPRVLDPQAVDDFLTFGFVPGPRTLLRGVATVPAGGAIYADRRGVREWSYWRPHFRPHRDKNLEQQAQALLTCVDGAVAGGDDDDVVALSSGLGSAFVAAVAARRWPGAIRTVTVTGVSVDEGPRDADAARVLETQHAAAPGPEDLSGLWSRLLADGEPPLDASGLMWLAFAQALRAHGRRAWTGLGNDVVFAAAARYRATERARLLRADLVGGLQAMVARRSSGRSRGLLERYARRWAQRRHQRWYTQDFLRGLDAYDGARRWSSAAEAEDGLSALQAVDLSTTVPYGLLPALERAEAHSELRWRHPLLDDAVVMLVGHLPDRYRMDVDHDRVVLQRAARRLLPPQIALQPAHSSMPRTAEWLRGPLRESAQAILFDGGRSGLFEPEALRQAWYRLALGRRREAPGLWRVAALEAWVRAVL